MWISMVLKYGCCSQFSCWLYVIFFGVATDMIDGYGVSSWPCLSCHPTFSIYEDSMFFALVLVVIPFPIAFFRIHIPDLRYLAYCHNFRWLNFRLYDLLSAWYFSKHLCDILEVWTLILINPPPPLSLSLSLSHTF